MALRTPIAAKPSARFADAAARYARLRNAPAIAANGQADRGSATGLRGASANTSAAIAAGTMSRQP